MNPRLTRALLVAAVLLLPGLCMVGLVEGYLDARLLDFVPGGSNNDETMYWHQTATFKEVGFEGGYYTAHELPAKASFTRFYLHGPVYPLLYGTLARVFGWELWSAPFYNLAFVTLALGCALWLLRPDRGQLLAIALVLVTSWPLVFYLPSNMQESLHHGFALVFAALFARVLRDPPGRRRRWLVAVLILTVVAAASLRPTWLLLLIALGGALVLRGGLSWKQVGALAGGLFVLAVGTAKAVVAISAPWPLWRPGLPTLPIDARAKFDLENVAYALSDNLAMFHQGNDASTGLLYEIALLGLVCLVALGVYATRLRRSRGGTEERERSAEYFTHAVVLVGLFAFLMLAYSVARLRGVRLSAPHVLLSLTLLVAFRRYRILVPCLALQLYLLSPFLTLAQSYRSKSFEYGSEEIEAFRRQAAEFLTYDPDAETPWCNTILCSVFPPWLLGVPPGMGISFILAGRRQLELPLKSRYVILAPEHIEAMEKGEFFGSEAMPLRLRSLKRFNLAQIQLNLDSPCQTRLRELDLPREPDPEPEGRRRGGRRRRDRDKGDDSDTGDEENEGDER